MTEHTDNDLNPQFKLPEHHILTMRYVRDGKIIYIVTKNRINNMFTLFSVGNKNKLKELKTAYAPTDFDEIY